MNTVEIISCADPGNSASPDLDLRMVLRYKVLPEFVFDVRAASWRRQHTTLSFSGTRSADAPDDLDSVRRIMLSDESSLDYIGEDESKVLIALLNSTPGTPTGYWIESPGAATRHKIMLDCVPANATTCSLAYLSGLYWAPDSDIDLNPYIPATLQWALVEGLKRELWRERAGVGDQRYMSAAAEYEQWKDRAIRFRDLGPVGNFFKSTR